MKTYRILLPLPFNEGFDYNAPEDMPPLEKGQLVTVPFQGKEKIGIVWETNVISALPADKIKSIYTARDEKLPLSLCDLMAWVAAYYMAPLGLVLKMVIPTGSYVTKKIPSSPASVYHTATLPILSQDQRQIAQFLIEAVHMQKFVVHLVEGVAGSGKTEVYGEAIAAALSLHKQVLVLLPEIALSHQWQERFQKRFGTVPHVWHSNTSPSQKAKTWQGVLRGEKMVIVGARSALFLPFQNLGLIIVDEEHDASYKQESTVMYNARDMAIVRAQKENIPVVLSTATPSLETLYNVKKGKYTHFHLPERYQNHPLPQVTVVDLRTQSKNALPLSPPLEAAIQQRLDKNQQTFLFLNRRGYAPVVLCPHCGHKETCTNCAISLVLHQKTHTLHCHHCGLIRPFPKECGTCHTHDALIPLGFGVERIAEEVQRRFPKARTALFTSDTMENMDKTTALLEDVTQNNVDILIGTQILTKGYHFPHLNLVGVIMGDLDFCETDLRAAEKTHQLLHQVAGRAGREGEKGEILIQTYVPKNPLLEALINHTPHAFYALELASRAHFHLPPFGRLAALIISATDEHLGQQTVKHMESLSPRMEDVKILGPTPAPLYKLRKWYRWRFLLKTHKTQLLQPFIAAWLKTLRLPKQIKLQIDIDPISFM